MWLTEKPAPGDTSPNDANDPNDAHTTLSKNMICCSPLSQGYSKLIGYIEKNEKATFNINMPYSQQRQRSEC